MPTSEAALCLFLTYRDELWSSPTKTVAKQGLIPFLINLLAAFVNLDFKYAAAASPSRILAVKWL